MLDVTDFENVNVISQNPVLAKVLLIQGFDAITLKHPSPASGHSL
jgi:hypothetical protein